MQASALRRVKVTPKLITWVLSSTQSGLWLSAISLETPTQTIMGARPDTDTTTYFAELLLLLSSPHRPGFMVQYLQNK